MNGSPRRPRAVLSATSPDRAVPPVDPPPELVLVTATLANRELRSAQATASHYAAAHAETARERDELARALAVAERDTATANAALERKIAEAHAASAALRCEMAEAAAAAERAAAARELEHESEVDKLRQRIAVLEAEQAVKDALLAERAPDMAELAKLAQQCEEERARYTRDTHELRLQLMTERVRVRAEEQRLREHHAEDVRRTAEELISTQARAANKLNKTLLRERSMLSTDIHSVREQAEALRQRNAKLQRNALLAAEAEAQYAERGARHKREIAALKEQVRIAEENLNEVVKKYEKQLCKQAKEHTAALKQRTSERDEAKSMAERLRHDLVKLRTLSRHLVQQRSELEEFFYDALAQVRWEMLEERRSRPHAIGCYQGGNMFQKYIPQVKRDHELLLISDRDEQRQWHQHQEQRYRSLDPVPSHSVGEGVSWSIKEMLPGGDSNSHLLSLPLIPLPCGNRAPVRQKRLLPAKEWGCVENSALTIHSPPVAEGELTMTHNEYLTCIPSAPTLKDLHTVEIAQLSWKEKERVLQILFNHLQGKSNAAKSTQCTPTSVADCLMDGVVVKPETNAFQTTFD